MYCFLCSLPQVDTVSTDQSLDKRTRFSHLWSLHWLSPNIQSNELRHRPWYPGKSRCGGKQKAAKTVHHWNSLARSMCASLSLSRQSFKCALTVLTLKMQPVSGEFRAMWKSLLLSGLGYSAALQTLVVSSPSLPPRYMSISKDVLSTLLP